MKYLNKARRLLFCGVLLGILGSAQVFAQQSRTEVLGMITYLDGIVDLYRDGELLDWRSIDIGTEVERYDLVETGDNGYSELEVKTPSSREVVVKINENTAFYLDFDDNSGRQQTKFEMLSGSLALKVQKLTGTGEVTVATESAVMGVRGTEFTVTAAPEGSILVTCETGKVACTNNAGQEYFAEPGKAVEQDRNARFNTLAADLADLTAFRNDWYDQKIESFIPNALGIVKGFARNYFEYLDRFNTAFGELMQHNDVFQRWERDINAGRSISSAVTDKIKVSPAVFRMRSILPMFERSFFRIKSIRGVYTKYHIKSGRLGSGYSTDDFFGEFDRQSSNLEWKLAQVRYIFKLYAKMSWSIGPGGDNFPSSGMDDIFSGGSPFGDSPFGGKKPF